MSVQGRLLSGSRTSVLTAVLELPGKVSLLGLVSAL